MKRMRMSTTVCAMLFSGMILVTAGIAAGQSGTPGMKGGGFIQRFDQNGDGKVSKEEFPGPVDHFTNLDSNGDGFVDASEAPKGPPPHAMKGGGFIQRFDQNGDGKVSKEEFTGPVDHFTNLDTNGDGFVDASEAPKGPPRQ